MTINGVQFDLFNYQKTASGVRLTINNATTAQLEQAIGESADIVISDEYRGYKLRVASMYKKYGTPIQHEIDFIQADLEEALQQNTNEIELQAGAIAEIAELLVNGDEEEDK